MKKITLLLSTILFAFLFIMSCKKQSQPTNPSGSTVTTTDVTKNVYSHIDTTAFHFTNKTAITRFRSHNFSLLHDNFPLPYIELNYRGLSNYLPNRGLEDYYIIAWNNRNNDNYNCDYTIRASSGQPVYFNLGGSYNHVQTDSRGFGFENNYSPGKYTVSILYNNGLISGTSTNINFTIYTEPGAPAGLLPFYRYQDNLDFGRHFYNSDWQEIASGGNGFRYERLEGYLYPTSTSASNLVPLYRFYNAALGDHIYTAGTQELGSNPNFVNEGITGYISTIPQGSFNTPLYRDYNGTIHFFSTPDESLANTGYNFEFIVGYIQSPPNSVQPPVTPQKVYEFYNATAGIHAYSLNPNLPNTNGFALNGQPFSAYATLVPGTVPVYQFVNSTSQDHVFTTNINPGWAGYNNTGIAFYAYSSNTTGTIPIYEYYKNEHYYSTSSTAPAGGWSVNGVHFYALPN